jgi:FKBP-type peptidyl-prolyl cis-trans isomerase 2
MTSIISESTTAIEDMKQTTMQVDGNAFIAGRELQFQLESTGGVEIKNYEYEYDNLNQ